MDPDSIYPCLAATCRAAIGSLHCTLKKREKLMVELIVRFSYDLKNDFALFGGQLQLETLSGLNKKDVSEAIRDLERYRLIQIEDARQMERLRRPILLTLLPDELQRVTRPPILTPIEARRRELLTTWLIRANRCYPEQPDLLPPEADEFLEAWADNSRTSALVRGEQNEAAKSGVISGAQPSEQTVAPGLAPRLASGAKSAESREYTDLIRRLMSESMEGANDNRSVGESPTSEGSRMAIHPPQRLPVGESPTDARDQISDRKIESLSSLSKYQIDDRPVGESPTGEPWAMPTVPEELFGEVLRLMGRERMANYSSWWFDRCKENRRAVYETIAANKLAISSPQHKPWNGGTWRKVFFQQKAIIQRVRQAAEATV